jgi:hypothetical protein
VRQFQISSSLLVGISDPTVSGVVPPSALAPAPSGPLDTPENAPTASAGA